ncbi:hypothetical protein [uncultured Clostridium sp.]|uniref:hypothetical protein n=1 Tax=uncultured Clostridium sp. TaxID=59620 RepID=UPI0032177E61
MKMGFKKSLILSGYNKGMLSAIVIYGICYGILYIAYLNGLVGIKDEVYLALTGSSVANKLIYPIHIITCLLEETMPIVLGIILFINYLKIFSYKAIRINITPINNRQKMSKLFLVYGMYYLIYMAISIIFATLIGGIEEGNIIKIMVHYIRRIGSGGVIILPLIIADVKGKSELLGTHGNMFWGAMLILLTGIAILIIMISLDTQGIGQRVVDRLLFIISIIEGCYILKKIDKSKIA